jgi:iron(III) transport system substrate-binding protein
MSWANRRLSSLTLVAWSLLLTSVAVACSGAAQPAATSRPQEAAPITPPAVQTAVTSRPPETAPITPALAQPADDSEFVAEWQALYEAAKGEGRLDAFVCCTFGEYFDKVVQDFERQYPGIHIVASKGASDEQASKALAEQEAGRFTLDIWMGGLSTSQQRLIPADAVIPLRPLLVHPEVLDANAWTTAPELPFLDASNGKQYVFAFGGNAEITQIAYNPNFVNPEDIHSYWDLIKPQYKGKIVTRDPVQAGSGANSTAFFYKLLGPDFFKALFIDMEATVISENRLASEGVAMGKWWIWAMAGSIIITETEQLKKLGLPIEFIARPMKEGSRIAVSGTSAWVMKNSPHPNAAKFFMNWFLSRDGQISMQKAAATQINSLRVDIPKDTVNPLFVTERGKTAMVPEADPGYVQTEKDAIAYSRQLLGR